MAKAKIRGSHKAAVRATRKRNSQIQARKKKEFMYRGMTLEQLKALPFNEVLELIPSRCRRTYLRGLNYEQQLVFDKLTAEEAEGTIRTHRRDLPILPSFVGKRVAVYNGKEFIEFSIVPEMIGCMLGEFVPNRKNPQHSGPGVGATRSSKFMPLK
ncbi:SSU ribosomal protein S19P [Thermoplasmatales archaeon BRNA1]|nr:SSU ribosomal protein S19P [Thermoplasmatales archaeon BRNA1]